MNEILIAIRVANELITAIAEAAEFLKSDEEIPADTLRRLQLRGSELDTELDDLIARRDSEPE